MKNQIKAYRASQTIEVITNLELIELEEDLFLFKRTVSSKRGASKEEDGLRSTRDGLPNNTFVGVVNAKGRAELMDGKFPSMKNNPKLVWMAGEWIEQMRLFGFYPVAEQLHEKFQEDESLGDVWEQYAANPQRSLDELVELDHSSHTIRDRHGNTLPVGIMFDYINSHIDESNYDLPKLFEHLSAREDVLVMVGDGDIRSKPQDWEKAKNFKQALFKIPYYNAEPGRTRSIQFIWQPSAEDYRKVLDKDNGMRHWKIIESDVLGIRQFQIPEN